MLYSTVVAFGKAVVPAELKTEHLRPVLFEPFHRTVGASVVGHDEIRFLAAGMPGGRRNELLQEIDAVPVEDYHCKFFHMDMLSGSVGCSPARRTRVTVLTISGAYGATTRR